MMPTLRLIDAITALKPQDAGIANDLAPSTGCSPRANL
jgi:hypothetical protein